MLSQDAYTRGNTGISPWSYS